MSQTEHTENENAEKLEVDNAPPVEADGENVDANGNGDEDQGNKIQRDTMTTESTYRQHRHGDL